MPYYVVLSKLTAEGRKTIIRNPHRIEEVNKELEKLGAKLITQYATMGIYDFVNIMEAANNDVMLRVIAQMASRGTNEPIAMPATSLSDFIKEMELATSMK